MNLQPSKLSGAASQVWSESSSLFQKKADVKIDLGLDKDKFSDKAASEADKSASTSGISSGYVFGARLIAQKAGDTTSSEAATTDAKAPIDVSSIFKKMTATAPKANIWKTAAAESPDSTLKKAAGEEEKKSETDDRLKVSAEELKKKSETGSELGSAEPVTTGEEDERNIFNANSKFYCYNPETKTWVERGNGTLRVNSFSKKNSSSIRIVGRTSGNQAVVINSLLFADMVLEHLSEKRIKISAQSDGSDRPQLFIIQASPASISQLYPMLQGQLHRVKRSASTTSDKTESRKRTAQKDDDDEEEDEAKRWEGADNDDWD